MLFMLFAWYDIDITPLWFWQDTLELYIIPESNMLSRNAALAIFSLETLRTLIIDMEGSPAYSDEFYIAMAEAGTQTKVSRDLLRSIALFNSKIV